MKDWVIPSFFPIVAVTLEVLAKLAPKFILKLRAFEAPVAKAVDFDTALLAVFANEVPYVIDFENTLESDFPIVLALLAFILRRDSSLPMLPPAVSVVELLVPLVLVVPSVLLFDSVSVIPSVSVCPLVSVTDEFVPVCVPALAPTLMPTVAAEPRASASV